MTNSEPRRTPWKTLWMLSAGAALLLGLAGVACGGGTVAPCSPSTCAGCCDSAGVCQPGDQPLSCGTQGGQCFACPGGTTCLLGSCFGGGTTSDGGGGGSDAGSSDAGSTDGGAQDGGTTDGGCTPQTCESLGKDCGIVQVGCGMEQNCGSCPQGLTCGANGVSNVCGCQIVTCEDLNAECGTINDGCGSSVSCGACPASQVCGSVTPLRCGPATNVTIHFDNLPNGTVVTSHYPQAAFSSMAGQEVTTFGTSIAYGQSPPNFICTRLVGGSFNCAEPIFIDFSSPVQQLKFHALGTDTNGISFEVQVFHGAGAATIPVAGNTVTSTPVVVDLSAYADVSRIEIVNVVDPGGVAFDDFTFLAP
jgi:hypothetical protein